MEFSKLISGALICFIIPFIFALLFPNWLQYKRLAKAKGIHYRFEEWLFAVIFILPSINASFIILSIYKLIVHLILSTKLKSKFGGFLKDEDSSYATDYPRIVTIPVVIYIEFDNKAENIYEVLKEFICTSLKTRLKDKTKVCGVIQNSFGYNYILKDEINIEDCIKKLKTTSSKTLNKSELVQLVEEYNEEPLPKCNRGFWEVSIGTQPVKWDPENNDETRLYPIAIKLSHSMGDGVNLIYKSLWKVFGDTKNLPNLILAEDQNFKKKLSFSNILEDISKFLNLPIVPFMLVNGAVMANETDKLIGPNQSPKKYFCTNEDHSTCYFSKVKEIKKNLPFNSSVISIFLTAYNASLTEFYRKYTSKIPKNISYAVTETEGSLEVRYITPDNLQNQKVDCTNTVGFLFLNCPTITKSKDEDIPVMEMLLRSSEQKNVVHQLQEAKTSIKAYTTLFSVFPTPIAKYLLKETTTAFLTNLPGPSQMTIMNGTLVKHLSFWCPHASRTGISLAISTFNRKLELNLNIDRSLVSERSQVQEILNGIYKYLDIMHNNLCSKGTV